MKPNSSGSRGWLAVAVIATLAVVFFFPALRKGASVVAGSPMCDVPVMFYPHRAFANGELQHGRLPLWNPYIFCGHPFHAEGQGAVFYPINLLLGVLPPSLSLNLFALLHFAGAGLFLYLYLREIGMGVFASFLGSLAFQYSWAPISRLYAGHYTIIPFLALVPALLWLWECWRRRGGAGWLAGAALIYGCMGLGGYPQLFLYSTLYMGLHALFGVVKDARAGGAKPAARTAGAFAAVVLGGALFAAVQLFPSNSFAGYSSRHEAGYQFSSSFSFAPENLLTLLAPEFFGDTVEPGQTGKCPYWGRNFLWEMCAYVGILPLALGLMAAVRVRIPAAVVHVAAVLLFGALALGRHTPLFRLMYHAVPFLGYFRGSCKFILFAQISMCVLAAFGAERLLAPTDERRLRLDRWALLAILGLMAAIGLGLLLGFGWDTEAPGSAWGRFVAWRFEQGETPVTGGKQPAPPSPVLSWETASGSLQRSVLLAGAALAAILAWKRLRSRPAWGRAALLVLTLPELWLFDRSHLKLTEIAGYSLPAPFVSTIRNDPDVTRVITPFATSNIFEAFHLETVGGYVGALSSRSNNFLTAVAKMPRGFSMVWAPVAQKIPSQWQWANVRYVLGYGKDFPSAGPGEIVCSYQDFALYRLRRLVPRAYFSANRKAFPSAEQALTALESGQANVLNVDLVEGERGDEFAQAGPPVEGDRVEFVRREPDRVVLSTTAAGRRLLVLSDTYNPDWRCRIDNREPAKIYPVNIAFRGVIVPEGKHEIDFYYAPVSFYWGLATSCAALAAAVALLLFRIRRPRGEPSARANALPPLPE